MSADLCGYGGFTEYFGHSAASGEPKVYCTYGAISPAGIFTSKNGPAELSLHSLISCCLVSVFGQRLGSVDSNGSITCTQTHTG